MFYFCAHDSQMSWATSIGNEAKSKVKHFRYAHAEIQTRLVCGPSRYQLDHRPSPDSLQLCEIDQMRLVTECVPTD